MKKLLLIPMAVLLFSLNSLAVTEGQCVAGDGKLIVPQNVDPREGDQRSPFCQCEQGYTWNGTSCFPISAEILCESSDGTWVEGSCECPEWSLGWNDKVGCDYNANPESTVSTVAAPADSKNGYISVIVLLLLLLCAILIYFIARKKKKQKGDFHEK